MADSSQKFIARNRAPRVQIEYDVELYGSSKKVQLPFVMGVMSDLSGKSRIEPPSVSDRNFLEIDVDNFDERMKAMAPRVAFTVPNSVTGEGDLSIDLTFEKMADFSPAEIAARIEPLKGLLEARTQLSNLMAYMDGKTGAETLIEKILANPTLLASLASSDTSSALQESALESLRSSEPSEAPEEDQQTQALEGLKTIDRPDVPEDTSVADALSSLPNTEEKPEEDSSSDVLANLADAAPEKEEVDTSATDALSSLAAVGEKVEEDDTVEVLGNLAASAPIEGKQDTSLADVLSSLPEINEPEAQNESAAVLAGLATEPSDVEDNDTSVAETLASLSNADEFSEADDTADVLTGLAGMRPAVEEHDTTVADVLSSIPEIEDIPDDAGFDSVLSGLATEPSETDPEDSTVENALYSLPEVASSGDGNDAGDILSGLAIGEAEMDVEDTSAAKALSSLPALEEAPDTETFDDILDDLASDTPELADENTAVADVLSSVPEFDSRIDDNDLTDILGDLSKSTPEDEIGDTSAAEALAALSTAGDEQEEDSYEGILEDLLSDDPEQEDPETSVADVLSSISEIEEIPNDGSDDIFTSLSELEPNSVDEEKSDDTLSSLSESKHDPDPTDDLEGLLADLVESPSTQELMENPNLEDVLDEPETPVEETAEEALGDRSDDLNLIPEQSDMKDASGREDLLYDPFDADQSIETDALVDDLLRDLAIDENENTAREAQSELDDLLNDPGDNEPNYETGVADPEDHENTLVEFDQHDGSEVDTDLDSLLDDLTDLGEVVEAADTPPDPADEDALLNELEVREVGEGDDLDSSDLLSDIDISDEEDTLDEFDDPGDLPPVFDEEYDALSGSADDDLDALLSALENDEPVDIDDVLAEIDEGDVRVSDLDDLLGEMDVEASGAQPDTANQAVLMSSDPEFTFGVLNAERPDTGKLNRRRFRIALFGDFSGRSARGTLETGDTLANRKPILLDPDTVEDVIAGFATSLVLPIGKDGAGIEVRLNELDDLHPDELFEKVELFEGLANLKRQLSSGATAEHASRQLITWGEQFGQEVVPPRKSSSGNTVRADRKLSDFQELIGDISGQLAQASPLDELLARIVGPHIRKLPDPDAAAMQKAVDEALSAAMRLVLHHPEFQSLEAQWRSLDLIARSVETDDTLEVMLYDVSADEIAADLAAEDDLSKTGFVRLLTEDPLDEENGRGGFSALIGLYTFEETPPHAEILARIARVAAHVDAPFFGAMTPGYLDVDAKDRHPLVAQAWDTLRAMPEAGHLGLASPRFLLRRPYGAKSEPIYEFDFEEFTMSEGLKGMLWANPAVLVLILLARSFKQNGPSMGLGQVMTLGGMPYHFVNDRYGDQVALPCTERNLTLPKHEHTIARGYMPIVSIKGRDEIRLGSFNSVAGREILGPWSGMPLSDPSPPKPVAPAPQEIVPQDQDEVPPDDDPLGNLDDLLAGFSDDAADDGDSDDIDAELAALLEDL